MRNITKRLLAFVLAAAMILSLAPAYAQAAPVENMALNRPATCSDVEANTSFVAGNAVDGSESTRWATNTNVTNPWIEIDLDDGTVIKQINIIFERADADQNILGYKVEAEVDGAYQTIYTFDGTRAKQREKIILADAVTADKLKLTVTDYDDGQNPVWRSVSICEIEVYSAEFKSMAEIAADLNNLSNTIVDGETFEIPAEISGMTVKLNGADFEEIIGKDLSVHKPLTDKVVNVSFEVSNGTTSVLTADIPVTVKGLYEQAEGMNAKPTVIPEIQ